MDLLVKQHWPAGWVEFSAEHIGSNSQHQTRKKSIQPPWILENNIWWVICLYIRMRKFVYVTFLPFFYTENENISLLTNIYNLVPSSNERKVVCWIQGGKVSKFVLTTTLWSCVKPRNRPLTALSTYGPSGLSLSLKHKCSIGGLARILAGPTFHQREK